MGKRRPTLAHPSALSIRARLGYSLQCQRVKRGWTQGHLAERADLSLKYLGEVERGTANVTIENVEILSRLLNWNPFADALLVTGPGMVESARLVLRAELRHITDTITLVLNELEPLADASTAQREGGDEASV
jgi:transcriptional regulator with XRE-family HTH domain